MLGCGLLLLCRDGLHCLLEFVDECSLCFDLLFDLFVVGSLLFRSLIRLLAFVAFSFVCSVSLVDDLPPACPFDSFVGFFGFLQWRREN